MDIIAVCARKGGVGKTTLTAALGSILAGENSQRVLVVDLDPQGNCCWALGGDPSAPGIADVLQGREASPFPTSQDGLAVYAPGTGIQSEALQYMDQDALRDHLEGLPYDLVLLDSPPFAVYLERLALRAASTVLVPYDQHPFSFTGAQTIVAAAQGRREPPRVALVANRTDLRRTMDQGMMEAAHEAYPELPVHSVVQDAGLAQTIGELMPYWRGGSCVRDRAYEGLNHIAGWILERN